MRYTTIIRKLKKMLFAVKTTGNFLFLVAFCILCSIKPLHSQTHFDQWIVDAKSFYDDQGSKSSNQARKKQIAALEDLVPMATKEQFHDTLTQIFYAISFRKHAINSSDFTSYAKEVIDFINEHETNTYHIRKIYFFLGNHYLTKLPDSSNYYYKQALSMPKDEHSWYNSDYKKAAKRVMYLYLTQKKYPEAESIISQYIADPRYLELDVENQFYMQADLVRAKVLNKETDINQEVLPIIDKVNKLGEDVLSKSPNMRKRVLKEKINMMQDVGAAYTSRNQIEQVKLTSDKILHLNNQLANDERHLNNFITYTNLFIVMRDHGEYNQAYEHITKAKSSFDSLSNTSIHNQRKLLDNLAIAHMDLGQLEKANQLIDEAIELYVGEGESIQEILNSHQKAGIMNLLYDKATILHKKYNNSLETKELNSAINCILQADTLLNVYLQELVFQSGKFDWKAEAKRYFELGVDLAYEAKDTELMWYMAEKSKGGELINHLTETDNEHIKSVKVLKDSISNQNALLSEATTTIDSTDISSHILVLEKELLNIYEQQNKVYGFEQTYHPPKILRKNLKRNEIMIQYASGVEHYYAITLDKKDLLFYKLDKKEKILENIEEFRKLIVSANSLAEFSTSSQKLYSALINPMENSTQAFHSIIVPVAEFSYIPFAALMDSNQTYYVENHSISYGISPSLFHELRKSAGLISQINILAPDYPSSQDSEGYSTNRTRSITLEKLPFAQEEASFIKEISNGTLTKKAGKREFQKLFENSHLLHFSGHAVLNPSNEELTYLALRNGPGTEELTALEISQFQSNCALVSLSACNTLPGKIRDGEGIFGINRAFFQSGAKSVLSTLWEVNDQSSFQIVKEFYTELFDQNKSKDQALRGAQLLYLESAPDHLRHPYYWAGVVIHGNPNALIQTGFPFKKILIGLLILVVLFLLNSAVKDNNQKA